MNWLFKEEPSTYSFDALVRDRRTVWSGVKNPLAQKHLHAVRKGDGAKDQEACMTAEFAGAPRVERGRLDGLHRSPGGHL